MSCHKTVIIISFPSRKKHGAVLPVATAATLHGVLPNFVPPPSPPPPVRPSHPQILVIWPPQFRFPISKGEGVDCWGGKQGKGWEPEKQRLSQSCAPECKRRNLS